MRHKPKTRRHLAYDGRRFSVQYRMKDGPGGERVTIRSIVNTGKVYANEGFGTNRRKRFAGIQSLNRTLRMVADQGV